MIAARNMFRGGVGQPTREDVKQALDELLIVVPSINGAALLERMLPSLSWAVRRTVVLDQASTDDTHAVCARHGVELLRLGEPRTYTQACNLGLELARQRGCRFLIVANNDVRLVTDVVRELLGAALDDDNLAVVAPAEIVVDAPRDARTTTYRMAWNLEALTFLHDRTPPGRSIERLEADFCEFTFALIRVACAEAVGVLDEEYEFYHEDADFCFRLRQAGYSIAYLPQSQIEHHASSTFSGALEARRLEYMRRNRSLFARKHLGYGVRYLDCRPTGASSWDIINRNLHPYLRRHGLINEGRPELIFAHPGAEPFDYLYTAWETSRLPVEWVEAARTYRAVFTISTWNRETFERAGAAHVRTVPLGVETDVYAPWGPVERPFEETTFLWFARNQYRKGLDVMRRAWARFRRGGGRARLLILGHGVLDALGLAARARHSGNLLRVDLPEEGVSVWEVTSQLGDADLAVLYRSVDFLVSTARSEGFGFSVAEAMACGTVPIFGDYGGSRDLACDGALLFEGRPVPAEYGDKGFEDVGSWWEPDVEAIAGFLARATAMDRATYEAKARTGFLNVRAKFTWRHTCFALRAALVPLQHRAEVDAPPELNPVHAFERRDIVSFATDLERAFPAATREVPTAARAQGLSRLLRRRREEPSFAERERAESDDLRAALTEFDEHYYLEQNPDVVAAGADPLQHYVDHGWKEGRRPSRHFDSVQHVAANGRARAALLRRHAESPPQADLAPPRTKPLRRGVLFIGYVEAGLGYGESQRNLVAAVARTDLPFAIHPYNFRVEDRYAGPFMPDRYDFEGRYRINVFEAAADQLPAFYENLGHKIGAGYNILRTYWELAEAPREWGRHLARMHEIWAPTEFVARAFRTIFDGPITIIPPCVVVDTAESFERGHFGLDRDRFYFLFTFDFNSWPTRKNPLGVLDAFRAAFPTGDERVGLVVKSTGAPEHSPATRAAVAAAAARDPRIRVIDATYGRDEVLSLIAACDGYVSLHRAEGFGLGMAEAMALGKPVIGTAYSGSADFLSEETGFPVPFRLRPLMDGEYVFGRGQSWAEPDVAAAARLMRQVLEEPGAREARARVGRSLIAARYGRGTVGRLVRDRAREMLTRLDAEGTR